MKHADFYPYNRLTKLLMDNANCKRLAENYARFKEIRYCLFASGFSAIFLKRFTKLQSSAIATR